MTKTFTFFAVLLGLFSFASIASSNEALVTAAWVKSRVGQPNIIFLDTRHLEEYNRHHVVGAIRSPYADQDWRYQPNRSLKHLTLMPDFAVAMGNLGITNTSHVVIIHAGRTFIDVAHATRIYWTFKLMGHQKVSLLDGGMKSYFQELGAPLETINRIPKAVTYQPAFTPGILARLPRVQFAINTNRQLIDFRTRGQFLGINKLNAVQRYGTLPSAINFPVAWLTHDAGGKIRPAKTLLKLFGLFKVDPLKPSFVFSDVGHLGSLGWFVMYEILGNKQARLYAPGLIEWAKESNAKMERKIRLE